MPDYLLEVIACSLEDARAAQAGGADRLELCSRLDLGGLTPSRDLVVAVVQAVRLPVRVMIRTNAGFVATEQELEEMERQVASLVELPIQGLVCGFLDAAGQLDFAALDRVLRRAPLEWRLTFHHAFDAAVGTPEENFAAVRRQGRSDRILSRGSARSEEEGRMVLGHLSKLSDARLELIAGGGLTAENLPLWISESGCREFHVGRSARALSRHDAPVDESKVRAIRQLLDA